jgi:uncharacterized protein (DUF736 family)
MATIGTFERVGDSEYLGDIFTLSLRAKNVRIVSVGRTSESAPIVSSGTGRDANVVGTSAQLRRP